MLLYEVTDAFNAGNLEYAVLGGFGMALHGLVRATMDIDLAINLNRADFELAESILSQIGLTGRLPVRAKEVFAMREEYIEHRNLIAWSFVDYRNPSRQVDIIITHDRRRLKTQTVAVAGRKISVVTLPELLRMKKAAGRPQDLVDVATIEAKLRAKS